MKKLIFFILFLIPVLAIGQSGQYGNQSITVENNTVTIDTLKVKSIFGAYDCTTYAAGNDYQSTVDAMIIGYANTIGDELYMIGYSDASSTPTTLLGKCGFNVTGAEEISCTITFFVRAGEYFKVDNATKICYLPLNY